MRSNGKNESQFSAVLAAAVQNLSGTGRGYKQLVSIVIDASLVVVSLWLAFTLTIGQPFSEFQSNWYLFLFLPVITVIMFGSLGIYRWIVRTSNMRLYQQLAKGAVASSLFLMIEMFLSPASEVNPRSVFVIYGLLFVLSTCSARLIWRQMFDTEAFGLPIAIYGSGSAGQQLVAMLRRESEFRPVCFIDDTEELKRAGKTTVFGLPVLFGESPDLEQQVKAYDVAQIVIALPSMQSSEYLAVVNRLERLSVPFKTLPSMAELMSGRADYGEFREISITDILERCEVPPDPYYIKQCIEGKSVLVTGGGGSIGSEICRQIVRLKPSRLTILDNSEANIYHITEDIEALMSDLDVKLKFEPVLCSVTDKVRVRNLFERNDFDTVYHAAAYKHVPIVEANPQQGVEVNVFGTLNVVEAAIDNKVLNFLLISTDKAVRPTSVMGCTKRVAELILQAKSLMGHSTIISMVRFGNVLASTGSVVPKFQKQIDAGGPVTLTHADITRYFMTIPEASQLVLQASSVAKGGDVFVLEMGEPIKISRLADTMIRLHQRQIEQAGGRAPEIAIKIIGLRPGEKMYEELFIDHACAQTVVPKVLTAEERHLNWEKLEPLLRRLCDSLKVGTPDLIVKQRLQEIVFNSAQHTLPAPKSQESVHDVQRKAHLRVVT